MSESDYPFQVVYWPQQTLASLTPAQLLHRIARPPETSVVTRDVDQFFQ